jgi:N-acetyl-gamma-glutamyl-phosphate reductase
MSIKKIKIGILGGSGYTGGELIRLLVNHPNADIKGISSGSYEEKPVTEVHSNLLGFLDQKFLNEEDLLNLDLDIVFLALPHTKSKEKLFKINLSKTKVVDLSADFRFFDHEIYEEIYKTDFLPGFEDLGIKTAYGLSEVFENEIKDSGLIACPGCFPTSVLIPIIPLMKEKSLENKVIIDSKTGSSGAGTKPSKEIHHPELNSNFFAYKIFNHRHQAEIQEKINFFSLENFSNPIFTPHLLPVVRGIFSTIYLELKSEFVCKDDRETQVKVQNILKKAYKNNKFIRVVPECKISNVVYTNFCDISVFVQGKNLILTSVIDNLIKGASGQAIQNMNLLFNLPEETGLYTPGFHP